MPQSFPHLAALLYLAAAALVLAAVLRNRPGLALAGNLVGTAGLLGQLFALVPGLLDAGHVPVPTLAEAAALVGAVVAGAALFGAWRGQLKGATVALWLTAGVLAIGGASGLRQPEQGTVRLELLSHIVLSALAAGLLSVAAILVLLLAAQSARLRSRRPLGLLSTLPPLESLESAVFHTVMAGFVLLSLSLLSGFLFIQDLFAQHLVHKTVLSLAAWCIFGVLLVGRHRFGWRGRQALRFLLGGYITLALAYFGSRFVLEALLHRHWG